MKQISFLLILALVFIGCSSNKKEQSIVASDEIENGVPRWVNQPDSLCSSFEICGVGEGSGFQVARTNARVEIAKYFGTQVISKFKVSTTSDNGKLNESVGEDLQEITDQVLEEVELKRRFEGKESVFVFMSLNKNKAAKRIRSEISAIDKKLVTDFEEKSFAGLFRARKLYNQRETLNLRYQFFKGNRIPEKVSYRDISELQKTLVRGKSVVVNLSGDPRGEQKVEQILRTALSNIGFKIKGETSKSLDREITGSFSSKESYLNVNGFKKFEFTLDLKAKNSAGTQVGGMNYSKHFTGRTFRQSEEQAVKDIKDYIEENLDKLNL